MGFPGRSVVKNLPASAGDVGSISGSGRSLEEGIGNPLQYTCLENPMDREAWRLQLQGHKESDVTDLRAQTPLLVCRLCEAREHDCQTCVSGVPSLTLNLTQTRLLIHICAMNKYSSKLIGKISTMDQPEGKNIKSGFHATCCKIYGGVGRRRREERETERTGVSVLVGLLINHQEHMVLNLYLFGTDLNPLAITFNNPTVPRAVLSWFLSWHHYGQSQ